VGRGARDGDDDAADVRPGGTSDRVQRSLEWLVIRAAHVRRRARCLTALAESAVVWCEPGEVDARQIVVSNGAPETSRIVAAGALPAVPPGHRRARRDRQAAFTVASFDAMRVLTTELKRLVASGAPVVIRLGPTRGLAGDRLARVLRWL
jgi:hypothetical protein